MRMHNPPHPGEVLRELCIEPLGLSVTDAAKALGVARKTLSAILNGHWHQSRNGHSSRQSFRHFAGELAEPAGSLRSLGSGAAHQETPRQEPCCGITRACMVPR